MPRFFVLFLAAFFLAACFGPSGEERAMLDELGIERARVDDAAGHSVSYIMGGNSEGRRVILVHGSPGFAESWSKLIIALAHSYEVIAIDRPGFGETTPRRAERSLAAQAAAVAPFLEPTAAGKPILLGHSYGGPVVAQAAADYPEQIGGLVIAAGSLDPDLEEVKFIQRLGTALSPLVPRILKHTNQEILALRDELELLKPRLSSIAIPIEIVHGTKDDLVPYENVAYMTTHLTGTDDLRVNRLDGVDHFLQHNQIDVLKASIDYLDDLLAKETD